MVAEDTALGSNSAASQTKASAIVNPYGLDPAGDWTKRNLTFWVVKPSVCERFKFMGNCTTGR